MQISFYHETSPVKTPFPRPHAPPERSNPPDSIARLKTWSMRLHFHHGPPATDLISKPHAPDHKPHPNDPGDRNSSLTRGIWQKGWALVYLQKCRDDFALESGELA